MSRTQKTFLVFGVMAILAVLTLVGIGLFSELPGEKLTPSGIARNQSLHVQMRDDVLIAIDVWLPEGHAKREEVPALINPTRFWRALELGMGVRIQIGLGMVNDREAVPPRVQRLNEAGFAVVVVDTRGSGASFGERPIEWSPDEIEDLREVTEWIQSQPWSDGRVGGYGAAYEANALELLMESHPDLLHAAAIEFHDYDPQGGLLQPGGVFNRALAELQDEFLKRRDENWICEGLQCLLVRLFIKGVKPVDGDEGAALLEQALAARQPVPWLKGLEAIEFRDDEFAESGYTLADISPAHRLDSKKPPTTPVLIRAGWLDAGAARGALARFEASPQPQELWIAPFSRLGGFDTDPFEAADRQIEPTPEEQFAYTVEFLEKRFAENPEPARRIIRYRPLGGEAWLETDVWPPSDLELRTLFLADENQLVAEEPTGSVDPDEYVVDFTTTTGAENRWSSPLGLDIVYRDRTVDDKKLSIHTSEPLEKALQITGEPLLTVSLASTTAEGALHAYLEAVSPSGKVVYLTEGILRFDWRTDSPLGNAAPSDSEGRRADAAPLKPGAVATLRVSMFATAAEIPAGYRIRVALAGHDASVFDRYPKEGDPVWTIYNSATHPSKIVLPVKTVSGE